MSFIFLLPWSHSPSTSSHLQSQPSPPTLICCRLVARSSLTIFDHIECSQLGSSAHGISQASMLKWVAISYSRGLPDPGIELESSTLTGKFFTTESPGKPPTLIKGLLHLKLEKAMAIHSSNPAWEIPWMEEPGGLQSMGSQRDRHNWLEWTRARIANIRQKQNTQAANFADGT